MAGVAQENDVYGATLEALKKYHDWKPKLTRDIVTKPCFRFVLDVVTNLRRQTGFAKVDFSDAELDPNAIRTVAEKRKFVDKISNCVPVPESSKLITRSLLLGLETDKTNRFLQHLVRAAAAVEPKTHSKPAPISVSTRMLGDIRAQQQVNSPVQPVSRGSSPVSRGPCLVCEQPVLVDQQRIKCDGGYLHQECADRIKSGRETPSPKLKAAIAASPALGQRLSPEPSSVPGSPQISQEDMFAATTLQEISPGGTRRNVDEDSPVRERRGTVAAYERAGSPSMNVESFHNSPSASVDQHSVDSPSVEVGCDFDESSDSEDEAEVQKRLVEQAEVTRLQEQAKKAEAEAKKAAEEAAVKKAAEEAAVKKAAEEAAVKKAAEEAAAKNAAEEAEAKRAAQKNMEADAKLAQAKKAEADAKLAEERLAAAEAERIQALEQERIAFEAAQRASEEAAAAKAKQEAEEAAAKAKQEAEEAAAKAKQEAEAAEAAKRAEQEAAERQRVEAEETKKVEAEAARKAKMAEAETALKRLNEMLNQAQTAVLALSDRKKKKKLTRQLGSVDSEIQAATVQLKAAVSISELEGWFENSDRILGLGESFMVQVNDLEPSSPGSTRSNRDTATEPPAEVLPDAAAAVQQQPSPVASPAAGVSELPLAPDWEEVTEETTGSVYFWNQVTNETCWDRPTIQPAVMAEVEVEANNKIEPTVQVSADVEPERYTTPPANPDQKVSICLRALELAGIKCPRLDMKMRLSKVISRILSKTTVTFAAESATVVILRLSEGQQDAHEVGVFKSESLEWKLWETGIQEHDIFHVVAPLPAGWHLCEDSAGAVFYHNGVSRQSEPPSADGATGVNQQLQAREAEQADQARAAQEEADAKRAAAQEEEAQREQAISQQAEEQAADGLMQDSDSQGLLPAGWHIEEGDDGAYYWHDDGQTQWHRPEADIPDTPASPSGSVAGISARFEHDGNEAKDLPDEGAGESSNDFDDDDELPLDGELPLADDGYEMEDQDWEERKEAAFKTLELVYDGVKQPNGRVRTTTLVQLYGQLYEQLGGQLDAAQAKTLNDWLDGQFVLGLSQEDFIQYFKKQEEFDPEHADIMMKLVNERKVTPAPSPAGSPLAAGSPLVAQQSPVADSATNDWDSEEDDEEGPVAAFGDTDANPDDGRVSREEFTAALSGTGLLDVSSTGAAATMNEWDESPATSAPGSPAVNAARAPTGGDWDSPDSPAANAPQEPTGGDWDNPDPPAANAPQASTGGGWDSPESPGQNATQEPNQMYQQLPPSNAANTPVNYYEASLAMESRQDPSIQTTGSAAPAGNDDDNVDDILSFDWD